MTSRFTLFFILTILPFISFTQTTFYLVTFEDGDPNAGTYTADVDNVCAPSDYFARVDDSQISANAATDYLGEQGTKYWAGEAHDDVANNGTCPNDGNQVNAKSVVFGPISISGKTDLALRIYVASNTTATDRYECDDRIDLTYSIDGGATQTALSFRTDESPATCASGGTAEELRQDKDLNGTGDAGEPALGQTFQQFSAAIPETGTNITVTMTMDNDAATEEMAVDHLELIEDSGLNLPVELSDFRVLKKGKNALLKWTTESEINNRCFEIERSFDNRNFDKIGEVRGMGTSYVQNRYSFLDAENLSGKTVFYRLRQLDFDGGSEVSFTESVSFEGNSTVSVFPNPVSDELTINFGDLNSETPTSVTVYSPDGREILFLDIPSGDDLFQLKTDQLKPGMYILQISNFKTNQQVRFIKN